MSTSSKKSKKKENKDKESRSTEQHSANKKLDSIPEDEKAPVKEQSDSVSGNSGNEEDSGMTETDRNREEREREEFNTNLLTQIYEEMKDQSQRLGVVEETINSPSRTLFQEAAAYNTPTTRVNKQHTRDKNNEGLLAGVLESSKKKNWKDLRTAEQGGSGSEGSSSDSTVSSSDSSLASDSSDSPATEAWKQRKKKKLKKKKQKRKNDKQKDRAGSAKQSEKNVLGQLFQSLDVSGDAASKTAITVTRAEKECTIRLQDFSLSKVCKAMKGIMEFQDRENTRVNMSKVLHNSLKKHLKVKFQILSTDLNTMPLSTLFSILAQETRVHSKVQFYSELSKALDNVKLMDWEQVTPSNHETFYLQQLSLAEDFMVLLRLMLKENKQYCPDVKDKPGGLIKLFSTFHSYTYWKYIWSGMDQRYHTMQEFMDQYVNKALQQYSLSQAMNSLPYHSNTKVLTTKVVDKEKSYYDKKREITKGITSGSSYQRKSLSHMNQDQKEDADSDDSRESVWRQANAEGSEGAAQTIENDEDSLSEGEDPQESQDQKDDSMLDTYLAAIGEQKNNKTDKKDYPCLRKILSGKCDFEGCPYGHRRETLLKGATDMKGKLDAFIKTSGVQR